MGGVDEVIQLQQLLAVGELLIVNIGRGAGDLAVLQRVVQVVVVYQDVTGGVQEVK